MRQLEEKFLDALRRAEKGDQAAAQTAFEAIIAEEPGGDLADDALYNIGFLQFSRNAFDKAEATFKKLIQEYPDSTIAEFENCVEHGATPAKAWYMLVNAYLAMGREVDAFDAADKLQGFTDSYVQFVDKNGVTFRKTYMMLAGELLDKYAAAKSELEMNQGDLQDG